MRQPWPGGVTKEKTRIDTLEWSYRLPAHEHDGGGAEK
jgi:hypothetical protein